MALLKEIWVADVQEALNMNAAFLPNSTDHSGYIAYKTVHVPQSGANPTVLVDPTVLPLTINQRTDTDLTYDLKQYALEPTLITNIDELQISYDKRQSVVGQQISTLTDRVGTEVAISWAASGATNLVETTGTAGTSLAPSATGTRKAVALIDIANLAKKLDKDNIPNDGRRCLLMQSDMFWELFAISDIVKASYNGFQNQPNVLQSGIVAQLFGFKIFMRPTVAVYTQAGTSAKASTAAATTGDRLACIAWHPSVVSRAYGSMNPMYDTGSSGTGKPEYLGSLFNMEVMLGSAKLRTDQKGVASLVQAWVS